MYLTDHAGARRSGPTAGGRLPWLACSAWLAVWLAVGLAAAVRPSAAQTAQPQPLRIGAITVESEPLFSRSELAQGRVYRIFDALHISTRPSLIRRFLLFREGDPYDPVKLAESERNLRGLDFLRSATITPGLPREGRLDVKVETQDSWSTEPNIDFSRGGGANTYSFDVTEKNLFGSGAEVTLTNARNTERQTRSVAVATPAFFIPYWNAGLLYADNSDGGERRLSLNRPLFSLANRWTFSFDYDHLDQDRHLYELGRTRAVFGQTHEEWRGELALSIGGGDAPSGSPGPLEPVGTLGVTSLAGAGRAQRLLFGADLLDDQFAVVPGDASRHRCPSKCAGRSTSAAELPSQRHFRYLYVGYESVLSDPVKLDFVNQGPRYEDFDLGRRFALRLGLSPHTTERSDRATLLRFFGQQGWRLGEQSFALARLSYEARNEDGGLDNQIGDLSLLWVARLSAAGHQTLVARADWSRGWRLDGDVQFVADSFSGLRAYPVHAYAGNKRLLFNVEDRFWLDRELAHAFLPGAALFVDSGVAQPPGTRLDIETLKTDVGAGLRIAIPRAANFVLRLDCAYQLNRDTSGRRGLVLSIGTTQAF